MKSFASALKRAAQTVVNKVSNVVRSFSTQLKASAPRPSFSAPRPAPRPSPTPAPRPAVYGPVYSGPRPTPGPAPAPVARAAAPSAGAPRPSFSYSSPNFQANANAVNKPSFSLPSLIKPSFGTTASTPSINRPQSPGLNFGNALRNFAQGAFNITPPGQAISSVKNISNILSRANPTFQNPLLGDVLGKTGRAIDIFGKSFNNFMPELNISENLERLGGMVKPTYAMEGTQKGWIAPEGQTDVDIWKLQAEMNRVARERVVEQERRDKALPTVNPPGNEYYDQAQKSTEDLFAVINDQLLKAYEQSQPIYDQIMGEYNGDNYEEIQRRINEQQLRDLNRQYDLVRSQYETQWPEYERTYTTAKGDVESALARSQSTSREQRADTETTYGRALANAMQSKKELDRQRKNMFSYLNTADSSAFMETQSQADTAYGRTTAELAAEQARKIQYIDESLKQQTDDATRILKDYGDKYLAAQKALQQAIAFNERGRADAIQGAMTQMYNNIQTIQQNIADKKYQAQLYRAQALDQLRNVLAQTALSNTQTSGSVQNILSGNLPAAMSNIPVGLTLGSDAGPVTMSSLPNKYAQNRPSRVKVGGRVYRLDPALNDYVAEG